MIPGRLLRQYVAVAEELHFGRAAERLNMAQSPLSQAIRKLEAIVGVTLLRRSKHFVALTCAGRVFLAEARELIAREQRAVDAARRAATEGVGRITIGFVGSVSSDLLPGVLREYRGRFPAVHVDLRELTSAEQIENLRDHKIDLGILRLPLHGAGDIALRTIAVERFVAVLPIDHRLAEAGRLTLKDLASEPFLVFSPDCIPSLHAKFLMACDESGFSPRIALEIRQMSSMVSLVAAGMGVALVPAQAQTSPHPGVVFKALGDRSEHVELKIAVAWRPDDMTEEVRSILSMPGCELV